MADLIRARIKITPSVEFIARYRYFRVVEEHVRSTWKITMKYRRRKLGQIVDD